MADDKVSMSIAQMSRTMGNAVLRERRRCAALVKDQADLALGDGRTEEATRLQAIAEDMLTPPVAQVVPTPEGASTGTAAPEPEPADENDGLPPVRHGDDFEDGVAIAHARSRVGGVPRASGFLTD